MKIITVEYSALVNLGNYNNEKIGFTAQLQDGETPEQIVEALRDKVKEIAGPEADELYRQMSDGQYKLRKLNRQIEEATAKWNSTAEFLRAQGLKPEAPDMPQFINLLPEPQIKEECVEVGEIEDDIPV